MRKTLPVYLILCGGILISLASYLLVRDWEHALTRAGFELLANTQASAIQHGLDHSIEAVTSVASFFAASKHVTRDEFRTFTTESLLHHGELQALEWVPHVQQQEREDYEQAARIDGIVDFHFTEQDKDGNISPAAERDAYFPVYYLEPYKGNETALGFNLGSSQMRLEALFKARDFGRTSSSKPIQLVQETGEQYGFLILHPAYKNQHTNTTTVDRRNNLLGFALGVFRISDLVTHSLESSPIRNIGLLIYNNQGGASSTLLQAHSLKSQNHGAIATLVDARNSNPLHWETKLVLPDQEWTLLFLPATEFFTAHQPWRARSVLSVGLLLTLALVAYLLRDTRRAIRTSKLAAELVESNKELEREVKERKSAESTMVKLSSALEQTADSVFITDRKGVIEYINPAFEKITGYTRNESIGKTPRFIASGKHNTSFYKHLWETIIHGKAFADVFINRKKNGSYYYEAKTITPLKNKEGVVTHFISTGKDVTEQTLAQERLQFMAHHDALTELPNRILFLDRAQQALAHAHRHDRVVAILFIDLDRFKNINDTLGHEVGDDILQKLANRLSLAIREGDTVARFGGDEFVILLDDIASETNIAQVAQKVLDELAMPFFIDTQEFHITASIGISFFPSDGDDAQALLKNADTAMYRAKDFGKNNYKFYSYDMSSRALERLTMEHSMRQALKNDEYQLYYQAQIDIDSGLITGVEALLRWKHPTMGLLSPGDFIPLLEETGLIVPVGEWALETACRQARRWHDSGKNELQIAVNISARQFSDSALEPSIHRIINNTGIKPENLELEITETALVQNTHATVKTLESLNAAGVKLAIDDFGTGYSSLSYLSRFEIDTLKIDRAFIHNIDDDAALVLAIFRLAESLYIDVIAEGVETEHQLKLLRELGCRTVQGYLFSKPLSADKITEILIRDRESNQPSSKYFSGTT